MNKIHFKLFYILLFLVLNLVFGCSYSYDQGVKLEAQERWAEAEIEYRRAYIDNPDDEEIKAALSRIRLKTSQDNFQLYQEFLSKKKYRKAYRRLESALTQNPQLSEAKTELVDWHHLLITGKIDFNFDRFSSNIELAQEMQLQVRINAPDGKILTGNISGENGAFYIEDIVYKSKPSSLVAYSLNSIGIKIKKRTVQGFNRSEFKKFINFRDLAPIQIQGKFNGKTKSSLENVLHHRPFLISNEKAEKPWFPPRLFEYELAQNNNEVQVITDEKRSEFTPDVLYINNKNQRAYIDFGSYILELQEKQKKWSILRKKYQKQKDDYFYQLSKNLAFNRYFFYDRVYRFVP